ncbi:MAG TPA: hypothetical protein VF841_00695 [Anaeromyxobacter sp.]
MTSRTALVAAALAVLAGCAKLDSVPRNAIQDCNLTVTPGVAATDILFVVDDSTSMGNKQTLLKNGLYQFIQALSSSPIAENYQIGVTTTSVLGWNDSENTYVTGPSAGVPYAAGTIVAIARDGSGNPIPGDFVYASGAYGGSRILGSGQASLVPDFEANVLVGVDGSNREEPFRAARLALEKAAPGGPNAGFLRPGARLAIVFLSDEDDCSGPSSPYILDSAGCRAAKTTGLLTPVSDVAAFLQGPIDGEVRDVVLGAIVGVAPGTSLLSCGGSWCTGLPGGNACSTATDAGARFLELLGHFPADHTMVGSICDTNFAAALSGLADVIMPDTLPLSGAPADWRMLVASLQRPGVGTVPCNIALGGTAGAATADAVYQPPQSGSPATLTFQNACAIQRGDTVDVKVICAG